MVEITDPVVLGVDFIDSHKVNFNFNKKSMKIGKHELILKMNREDIGVTQ